MLPLSEVDRTLLIASLSDTWLRLAANPATTAEAVDCRALLTRMIMAGKVLIA